MHSITSFRSLDELISLLSKEKQLLSEMFYKRKLMAFRTDLAREMVRYQEDRIRRLIELGVIRESGNFLEMESVYLEFFEEVLDVNDEISVSSVRECIDTLKENIGYYLKEQNEQRKYGYQRDVRQILRKAGLRTLKNIIDLKRNVENTFKQEPNLEIKKDKLIKLDEKKVAIKQLIEQCEKLIEDEPIFFQFRADDDMQSTIDDVLADFSESSHNLMEIDKQIIAYLNRINRQSQMLKKLRKVKYLKDQYTWKTYTDVESLLRSRNPVWMEGRLYHRIRLSIEMLRSDEGLEQLLRKIAAKNGCRASFRQKAEPLSEEDLMFHADKVFAVNPQEVWNGFLASGKDLMSFVEQYDYNGERTHEDHLTLFCQLVALNVDQLKPPFRYAVRDDIEYPLIFSK